MPVRKITLSGDDAIAFDALMEAMGYVYVDRPNNRKMNPSAFAADLAEVFRRDRYVTANNKNNAVLFIDKLLK